MQAKAINDLCDVVRQTAYDIHVYHSNGHLEKVYENALINFGSYRFEIRKYALSQGKTIEERTGKLACFLPFLSAFFAFFRG